MSLLTSHADHASLAECQANAIGPVPLGIAIHIVIEVARAIGSGSVLRLSPGQVLVGYDGSVALAPPGASDDRTVLSHRSPEQVSGAPLDRRSDVFSLGTLLWELLAGTNLFERSTDAATAAAILEEPILDVRSVNPDVPAIVGEVIATALSRSKELRFDDVTAFGRALAGARAASGTPETRPEELARWVAQQVPRRGPVPASAIPDLDLGPPRSARRPASPPVAAPAPAPHAAARASRDDDDSDMEIERNLATAPMPTSSRGQAADTLAGPPSSRGPALQRAGSGLELGAPQRLSARDDRTERPRDISLLARIGGLLGALLVLGLCAGALFRFAHRAGGVAVTSLLPHAFDGTSGNESGAVALVSLVVAVTIIFAGLRLQPHAWAIVASGAAMLLLALAMVTVTLASTGENPTPPDGVLLVPYAAPVSLFLLALGMGGRAGRILARARGIRRAAGVPLAALAGALAFAAFEISTLAARL